MTERSARMLRIQPPIHPGEILREEFLVPLGLAPSALAKALSVPRTRIERLVREERSITADMALRLARYFGTSVGLWINLQTDYDLTVAETAIATDLATIQPRIMEPDAA